MIHLTTGAGMHDQYSLKTPAFHETGQYKFILTKLLAQGSFGSKETCTSENYMNCQHVSSLSICVCDQNMLSHHQEQQRITASQNELI